MLYKKILLSLHCRDDEKRTVDEAIQLASFFKASLAVIVVNDPGAGKAHMMMDTLPRVTEDDVVNQLKKFGYGTEAQKIKITLVDSESYIQAIARTTKDFDLIIMGHHHKNRLVALLKDSTDEQVADRIDCPILLVPLRKNR